MKALHAQAIRTRIFQRDEPLAPFLIESLGQSLALEGKILCITSKIIALSEGRIVSKRNISKVDLIRRESDDYLGEIGYGTHLTIKHGLLIASAGIDESNSVEGDYILLPERPYETAAYLRESLTRHYGLQEFGVLITDSRTSPLRAGVTGVALSHAGFRGTDDRVGDPDLFGKRLKMTRINVADALAVAAVFCMGEAAEQTPIALLSAPVEFTPESSSESECCIPLEKDLYWPLLKGYRQPKGPASGSRN